MIVDAHHHIWRRADLPWLLGPTVPRIFGDYDAIKRDYPIAEYLEDARPHGVTQSVYVQANWPTNWFLDEVRFVSRAAEATGWPHAISAFADMRQDDARADLARLAAFPLVRGVRHQMHHHPNPLYRFAAGPEVVGEASVIQNARALADYGFVFELQVFAHQADAALRLIREAPDTTFVLQHAMMPADATPAGRAAWRDALARMAEPPNVVCKLSGLGTFRRALAPDEIAEVARTALDLFGAERCLWGSNFPIERIWTGFGPLIDAHRAALEGRSDEERAAVLARTAQRVYRLG